MKTDISKLHPTEVWSIFDAITRVPRPSKHEEQIRKWLTAFAAEHKLECKTDKIGNVAIFKPATKGMEDKPKIVLQAHMDMVCEKNASCKHDFSKDAIQTVIDGEWVRADGTTLGADCGIGMAAALAVLVSDIPHGDVEALFTVDEETGLTGAFNMGKGMIDGKILINLDSEDEGELFIGCAGGIDTIATFTYTAEDAPRGHAFYNINLSGLKGGHSGDNINDGLANSNRVVARLLWESINTLGIRLASFDGGNLRNAIPREARATVAVPNKNTDAFKTFFKKFVKDIKAEYAVTEPNLKMTLAEADKQAVVDKDTTRRVVYSIVGCPNGVQAMCAAIPGLVETSTNLASVKMKGNKIIVVSSQRSSVESAKTAVARAVESVFAVAGAKVEHSDGYPGWAPNTDSHILRVTEKCYKDLFKTAPKVRAIHAGLECGLFLETNRGLDMVSFGPTLRGVHSPDERLEIATVDKFWKLLVRVLAEA